MKKLVLILAFFLPCYLRGIVSIEVDASAYFPTNNTIRKIYGNVWSDFGVTIDHIYPFHKQIPNLAIFAQVDYLHSNGTSLGGNQSTKIQVIPITLGLKWIHKFQKNIECYFGVAPKYFFMKIKNNTLLVPQKTNDNGCGGYFSAGAFFYPISNLMIDLFFTYSYIKFKAPSSTPLYQGFVTNISGFNLGGGIGWKF